MPRPADASPTERLMACIGQLVQHYNLPQAGQIQILTEEPDPLPISRLSRSLLDTARNELALSEEAQRGGEDYDLAVSLAIHCGMATTTACMLRTAATAGSAAPPSDEAWELLIAVSTLLYVRARAASTTYDMVVFYSDLAVALNEA